MIDKRFYIKKDHLTFGKICKILDVSLPENCSTTKRITGISKLENATSSDVTFFHNVKYAEDLAKTRAFACVVAKEHVHLVPENTVSLIVEEPYLAHAKLLEAFYSIKEKSEKGYISPKASISKSATVEEDCYISDYAVISDGATIRRGTFIGSGVTILHDVEIGEESHIESNVTIGFAVIGKRAYIKTGARIGQQGFGFHVGKTGITDVLQIGRVIIGDDVQIGANCTIDRGSMSDTQIGSHSRLDNLVHIAHNVEIGEYCVIAAQTGIAGSTKIGSQCFLGGQVGIAGHISVEDKVTIAAQSGVMRNIRSGSKVAGTPAGNAINWHRQTVALQKLIENRMAMHSKGFFSKFKHLLRK